jgi:3-hydroxy-9,10-secoandrosta-1,3,5(10)-triene-9,17-dione monooxygenase reductase component
MCQNFAKKHTQDECCDKFEGIPYRLSSNGCPILEGALAVCECHVVKDFHFNDHVIFFGEVKGISILRTADPLVFYKGTYGTFVLPPTSK